MVILGCACHPLPLYVLRNSEITTQKAQAPIQRVPFTFQRRINRRELAGLQIFTLTQFSLLLTKHRQLAKPRSPLSSVSTLLGVWVLQSLKEMSPNRQPSPKCMHMCVCGQPCWNVCKQRASPCLQSVERKLSDALIRRGVLGKCELIENTENRLSHPRHQ